MRFEGEIDGIFDYVALSPQDAVFRNVDPRGQSRTGRGGGSGTYSLPHYQGKEAQSPVDSTYKLADSSPGLAGRTGNATSRRGSVSL